MNFRTLDLNLLRVFDVVMAERNVTRASEQLAMSQPAVSNALRRLRESMGHDLFIAGPTGVTPTRHAQAIWPAVRQSLDAMRAVLEPPSFDVLSDERTFVIAMADATAAVLVTPLMASWNAQHARPRLRIVGLDSRDPRPMLEHGQADAAIGFFPDVARLLAAQVQDGATRIDPLYECRYVCVMRRDHPLASRAALSVDDYCGARHLRVDFAGRPRGYVDEALARVGRERDIVLMVDHFSIAGCVLPETDLLSVLPRSFIPATGREKDLVHRALPFEVPRIHVSMLWHRRHEHDAGHQWLRATLAKAAHEVAIGLPQE